MPQGQEKSRKTKKTDKSQEKTGKNEGFWKNSGKVRKFDKNLKVSDLVSLYLPNSLYSKAFKCYENPLKSE